MDNGTLYLLGTNIAWREVQRVEQELLGRLLEE